MRVKLELKTTQLPDMGHEYPEDYWWFREVIRRFDSLPGVYIDDTKEHWLLHPSWEWIESLVRDGTINGASYKPNWNNELTLQVTISAKLVSCVTGGSMRARIEVIRATDDMDVTIRDIGPWDRHPTVTNDAEGVVKWLYENNVVTNGQRIFYYDSEDSVTELKHKNGVFSGFGPA